MTVMARLTLLFTICCCTCVLAAQNKAEPVVDNTEHLEAKDRSTQEFMNNTAAEATLVNGGAFYVNNPAPAYKVDVDKAYLDKEFRKMKLTFHNGESAEVFGRIRRVDQKVEVMQEGAVYELRDNYARQIEMEDGTTYVILLDPLRRTKGSAVYEKVYDSEKYTLLVLHTSEWQDPPQKNMFDTSEPVRTLKEKTEVILLHADGSAHSINNAKTLVRSVELADVEQAEFTRRRARIKNSTEDYVVLLSELE